MILFLDDSPSRTKAFRSSYPWATCCATAADMIEKLADCHRRCELVYMLFLDHDLGGKVGCDPNESDTGMEVVRWIAAHRPSISEIVIHSCNAAAAAEMAKLLALACYTKVTHTPFPDLLS